MVQGRIYALSLGAVVAPAAAAAAVVPPAAAPVAPLAAVNDRWVAMEDGGGYRRGDVIAIDPGPLPAGNSVLGDRAIIPVGGDHICARKMTAAAQASYVLEDLRVLPVHFDAEGARRREFPQCVERMNGESPVVVCSCQAQQHA